MSTWQVHWVSASDTGSGPLRASGYGDSPEKAENQLINQLRAWLPSWMDEAQSHKHAVNEAQAELERLAG